LRTSSSAPASWTPSTPDEHRLVKDELERIVVSAPFRNSRRYPAMLGYIVEKVLAGQADTLKERTLGVEVFQRPPDYDTNADPIVRFTAGEVRKRIAQFYRDNPHSGPVEITLATGTYVPQFRRVTPLDEPTVIPSTPEALAATPIPEAPVPSLAVEPAPPSRIVSPVRWALAAALTLVILGTMAFRHFQPAESPILTVWNPLLKSPDMVLISAGRPHPEDNEAPESPSTTIREHILRPEFRISLPTVATISQVAGFLQSQHKRFRIHEAYSNNLQDLHRRAVILINGNNNKWTALLLQPLRFHFVQTGDFSYIQDAEHPENRDWNVDFGQPYLKQTTDYAIVARFNDATTDGPVMVLAGISSNGTDAAGEFAASPEAFQSLAHNLPHGALERNFEIVLKVEVIGGNTGAATVVATHFW